MRWLLDTNIISDVIRNPRGKAATRLDAVGSGRVCTSIIVAAELRFGIAKKGSTILANRLGSLLSVIEVIAFAAPADVIYGRLRAQLERAGRPIGGNDLLIAAHAIALGHTVVTGNKREFSKIVELRCENWLE